jgi:signal transduction histidine kinase
VPATTSASAAEAGGLWLWHALFGVSAAITAVFVVLASTEPAGQRAAAVLLVLGTGAGWLLVGRRFAATQAAPDRPAVVGYVTVLVTALVTAVLLVPQANWAMFTVLPQLFWLLRLRPAVITTVVLGPTLPVLSAIAAGDTPAAALRDAGPQNLLITGFGVLLGVWIHRIETESQERANLLEEVAASRAEAAELSRRTGAAEERERLAGEIHDTLAQGLTSIVMLLQAAQAELEADAPAARRHLDLAVRTARENLQEARRLVAATVPGPLPTSLAEAVGRQVDRFAEQTGADTAHGTSGAPRRLPADPEILLLRAAQELLANIAQHAGAQTVTVRLDYRDPHAVALTVADDGAGFDPAAVDGEHFGLAMLATRTERLGGRLELTTAPGAGTTAVVTLPTGGPP